MEREGVGRQEVTVDLPLKGEPKIVRLYPPAQKTPVELQSIRIQR